NTEEYPGNDLIPAINTAIMANNCPDVFLFWRPESGWNVPAYAERGAIADLTALIKSPAFAGVFPEFALATASQIKGVFYCIPRASYFDEFLVNKTVFDKFSIPLPDTWEKLMNAVPALKKNGIIPWQITTANLLDSSSRILFNILNRQVGNPKALSLFAGKAHWTDPDVLTGLRYFVTLAANNGPPDSNVLDQNQCIAKYFNTGASAMLLENNGGNVNITQDAMKNLIAMAFPVIPGGVEKEPSTEKDVTNLVYASAKEYANKDKKDYIDRLIIMLANREAAKLYLEESNVIVPHLGLNINPAKILPLNLQAMQIAEKQPGRKWLISYTPADFRSKFRDACNDVWYGKLTAEQFSNLMEAAYYGKL
ncbi:MAG: extracellular solute-binding protein, partial [Treponema sp.]|nr:extracellular solute-binding protein [Treponema sp.]